MLHNAKEDREHRSRADAAADDAAAEDVVASDMVAEADHDAVDVVAGKVEHLVVDRCRT